MFIDRHKDTSPAAKGHCDSFTRVANILDLALAAAETADALERDFQCKTEATVKANQFAENVRKAPGLWADRGDRPPYKLSKLSVEHWSGVHVRFLTQADEILDGLSQHARLAMDSNHIEPLERLRRKVLEGTALSIK
jgi:hypothetical protein